MRKLGELFYVIAVFVFLLFVIYETRLLSVTSLNIFFHLLETKYSVVLPDGIFILAVSLDSFAVFFFTSVAEFTRLALAQIYLLLEQCDVYPNLKNFFLDFNWKNLNWKSVISEVTDPNSAF